ncbi:hypothetical protein [Gordonia iterans]
MRHHPRAAWRRVLIALLAVVALVPIAVGEAAAKPASPDEVRATVQRNRDDVKIAVANGSVAVEDGYLLFKNRAGKVVDKHSLIFVAPNKAEYDIAATVRGNTATLVPSKVAKKRKPGQIICGPQTRAQRDHEARQALLSEISISTAIGALIGTAVGAILSIALTAGGGLPIGVPIGALVGAGIGLGGAVVNGAFDRYFKKVNSKFEPKWC